MSNQSFKGYHKSHHPQSECLTTGEYQVEAKLSINRRKVRTSKAREESRSEICVGADGVRSQGSSEVRRSEVRGGESRTTGGTLNTKILKRNRKIERLERELRELKNAQEGFDQQRFRRQRSRSHSESCESTYRFPKWYEKDHKAQRISRRSKSGERARKEQPLHKPEKDDRNLVWKQLQQISHSPFSSKMERAKLPTKFTPLNLISYNEKTDLVAHLSHYRQSMALYNGNDALMCRIFPSSLGEVAFRWFDRLEHGSIHSWRELSKAFTTRFITNTRKPKEIDFCGEDLAVWQFKFGLPTGCKIRQSLTKKPPLNMTDLMSKIEQAQRKPRQPEPVTKESFEAVNTTFKEPIFKILPQIKDKPYFVWPPKMGGDPASRESKPYCAYHRKKGHLIENCRTYKGFLEELVRNRHLRQYVDDTKHRQQRDHAPKPNVPIGIIEVIHSHARTADLREETRMAAHLQEVFHVCEGATPSPKRLRKEMTEEITFKDYDLERMQLPHSDALVVTMRVGKFRCQKNIN
uniref:Retrotransposon gag domain-containing protein n=1 Tax=Fagus sylvatica TaxID=28930 RepID=A0A2N9G9N1_FAGSY